MYYFINTILISTIVVTYVSSFSFYNHNLGREKPPMLWNLMSQNLKTVAREWFIRRAEKNGVPWRKIVEEYQDRLELIEPYKLKYENRSIEYPNYYTQPFHGYDNGNLNWQAALEAKAATLSISSLYWKKADPMLAEQWMRNNASQSMIQYMQQYNISSSSVHTIMDMGSSTGISTNYIHQSFPHSTILGVELSPYFLATALYDADLAPKPNVLYLHANVENVPIPDNSFDLITCQFLLHEVPYWKQINILKEAHRLLKPEGTLAILDLNPYTVKRRLQGSTFRLWAFESTEPHIFDYYSHDMRSTMYDCGFINIVQVKNDPMNLLWLGKKGGAILQSSTSLVQYNNEDLPPFLKKDKNRDSKRKSRLCPGGYIP